ICKINQGLTAGLRESVLPYWQPQSSSCCSCSRARMEGPLTLLHTQRQKASFAR
ncbi:hypothetical protein ILYODFUR_034511, partial [Ilyodon furcidens]